MTLEIVRDYYGERTARLIERLVARRRAPGEATEASVCIGGEANFRTLPTFTSTVTTSWPGGQKPVTPPDGALMYTAVWWEFEDVRVENPTDSEQYVITKRIKQSRYRGPDGREHQFDNRPIFADFPPGA